MRKKGIEVQGSRRGRLKKRWADCVKDDLREKGLSGGVRPSCMEIGGDYHPTSTPHRSGIKMRKKGIEVQGSRRRGRLKRWADCVKDDLREKGLSGGVRPSCMEATIIPHRPHIEVG